MSKEKQIEEMAKEILKCGCVGTCLECEYAALAEDDYACLDVKIAEGLYNAGYRKQSEWISVDERLPEESGCYLVNIINHFGLDWVTFTYYSKTCGWGIPDVTHWMPLPQPPKKGGEE